MCDKYVLYYIRSDLFAEMREEGWTGEELWDRFVEVYFVFVSSRTAPEDNDTAFNSSCNKTDVAVNKLHAIYLAHLH